MDYQSHSGKQINHTMYDLISIGDATIDTLMAIDDASVQCQLKDNCKLMLNFADKIVVNSLHHSIAGNAANNAVGASRLGLKTALCTILGDDENGRLIKKTLKKEGVHTRFVTIQEGKHTNASTVINFKGERTILVYHAPRTYKLPRLPKSEWIYYTSIGENHKRFNREIVAYVRRSGAKMAYNPGSHQLKAGFNIMKPVLAHTEVLFVNVQEAQTIIGKKLPIENLLIALQKCGPKIVAITDGPNGSYVREDGGTYRMGILEGPAIERTGAGDSFATGFISALHHGKSMQEAICWGSINATSVIAKIGPQAGLLTLSQMMKRVTQTKCCAEAV